MEDTNLTRPFDPLTPDEKKNLLGLARKALKDGVLGKSLIPLDLSGYSPKLRNPGATFVTLTTSGELRGCIGSLEARRPLVEDVRYHAIAAALEDFRFPPVEAREISSISIEISRLTTPQNVNYTDPEELIQLLRPGIDGVILMEGIRRATFLPQVWSKVPDAEIFLSMLSRKLGMPSDYWKSKTIKVLTYQVEEFHE